MQVNKNAGNGNKNVGNGRDRSLQYAILLLIKFKYPQKYSFFRTCYRGNFINLLETVQWRILKSYN